MPKATWNNIVIAESEDFEKVEGNIYFPPESVKKEYLEPSDTKYTCPWKGEAKYYHIVVGGKKLQDGTWTYPDPKPAADKIRGYFSFSRDVQVRVY